MKLGVHKQLFLSKQQMNLPLVEVLQALQILVMSSLLLYCQQLQLGNQQVYPDLCLTMRPSLPEERKMNYQFFYRKFKTYTFTIPMDIKCNKILYDHQMLLGKYNLNTTLTCNYFNYSSTR